MEKQVKSKKRVTEHGEVFTAEREVKAMCDLVSAQCNDIDATFLEPACGNGNFLSEILARKLVQVKQQAKSNTTEWEWLSVRAVSSLYGVDIMQDNAQECRNRLFAQWDKAYKTECKKDCNEDTRQSVKYIISENIICGNALTMMCVDENQQDTENYITFAEFKTCGKKYFLKRKDYRLDVLLKENPDESNYEGQLNLFGNDANNFENWMIDPITKETVPKPVREYPPTHYRRIFENG